MTELEALADLERRRRAHEALTKDLTMERDQIIYTWTRPGHDPDAPSLSQIAAAIGVDRSWPIRIRDSFPERYKAYLIRQATAGTADPEAVKEAAERAHADADLFIRRIEAQAAKEAAAREARRERARNRRAE